VEGFPDVGPAKKRRKVSGEGECADVDTPEQPLPPPIKMWFEDVATMKYWKMRSPVLCRTCFPLVNRGDGHDEDTTTDSR
jgi:hypothetical protein